MNAIGAPGDARMATGPAAGRSPGTAGRVGARAPRVAVIVPVLNEAAGIGDRLRALDGAGFAEVIVVDGGSDDGTVARIRTLVETLPGVPGTRGRITLLHAPRGRAVQMNRGAAAATADVLLFLHADTRLPPGAAEMIQGAVRQGHEWGRFDVRLDGRPYPLRLIERAMNIRSALTGIATGDQAQFVRRDLFAMLRGFAPIPLMEDIELSRRLCRLARPARIRAPVASAARRWLRGGIARTVLRMWGLRFLYWSGIPAARLARLYPDVR